MHSRDHAKVTKVTFSLAAPKFAEVPESDHLPNAGLFLWIFFALRQPIGPAKTFSLRGSFQPILLPLPSPFIGIRLL